MTEAAPVAGLRVDVHRDGKPWLANQLATNKAMRSRVWSAVESGRTVWIGATPHEPAPPAPTVPANPWAGVGMFTVERPSDADGLRKVTYLLTAVDPFTWARHDLAPGIGAPGIVLQAETPAQLAASLERGAALEPWTRALVTNLDPSMLAAGWPAGYSCFIECYWNADGAEPGRGRSVPRMLYEAEKILGRQWGSVPVVPVVGCYDASSENPGVGVRLTLPDYLPDLQEAMRIHACVVGYAVWRVETLAGPDIEALR